MTDSETDKTTLMVVDDSRLMRVAARKILKNDFNIIEAADGEEAWEALQQHPDIALLMSDLSMPNLDGLGLLKRIRESRFSELPVIIITGAEDDDGSKKNALAAGASDFITKPFESVQLLARVKAQARQNDTQEALQQSEAEKQQLRETSQVDPLTGLTNKRAFINSLEENLAYATRHHTELSLLLVRIEKYKILYLRRGKQVAETLSRELAGILCKGRRREDTVGHVALDTFGILLPSANLPGSKRVLAQLTEAIGQMKISVDGKAVPFNVSFGLCTPDIRPGIRTEEVIALAEAQFSTPSSPATAAADKTAESPQPVRTAEVSAPAAPVVPEPVKYSAASPADIQGALEALASHTKPVSCADDLLRGILPILDNWNHSHGQRHNSLVNALRTALDAEESPETATTHPQRPPVLVD
jgi:diguanylate cyclase (GGDEF)-like protein